MSSGIGEWAEKVRSGDVRAISRAISSIENHEPDAEELLRMLFPHTGQAYLTGITGAPGTGKSTLVDRLAAYHRKREEPVGVIAVDPTSPYSGGAILGDRIRMQSHATDAGIFIRSMATRGFLGGLARATAEVALLLDAAGKGQVLIETVGVGQDEIDIVRLADCVLVVLVPGLGDDIQNMKAGLMEIGDIFVLNKADREGADRLEEQLHHSQRIEAMGRLAGGVAHDFNNLLMVISGHSQMLLDSMLPGDPARDDLDQVVRAADRATDLTRQLLAFSRRHTVKPALVNLNQLVQQMERMLGRVLGEHIHLLTDLASDGSFVHADPGQLEQVILNLALNARDAMPSGGTLTLKTSSSGPDSQIWPAVGCAARWQGWRGLHRPGQRAHNDLRRRVCSAL